MKGNGEECDESKRGMSAQRLVEMLLASLHGSNVQLLLCLRPPLHAAISAQAPGYGPCNGPIVSCHGSQSTSESLGPSGGALHFTLNIHVVLLVIIGWRTLRQWTANITMNNPPPHHTPPHLTPSTAHAPHHVFVQRELHFYICLSWVLKEKCEPCMCWCHLLWLWPAGGTRYLTLLIFFFFFSLSLLHFLQRLLQRCCVEASHAVTAVDPSHCRCCWLSPLCHGDKGNKIVF